MRVTGKEQCSRESLARSSARESHWRGAALMRALMRGVLNSSLRVLGLRGVGPTAWSTLKKQKEVLRFLRRARPSAEIGVVDFEKN